MKDFMASAKAIVIASHNMKMISDMCDSVLWLQKGKLHAKGLAADVVEEYKHS
jgi:ABC-type polysaccharide/polyol phosphate transport system ATPase subunit